MSYRPAETLAKGKAKLLEVGFVKDDVEVAASTIRHQLDSMYMINGAVRTCNRCALRAGCKMPVAGMGPVTSPLMIVGENPGEHDVELFAPFAGPSGQILTLILNKLGIDRSEVYITNSVKCYTSQPLTHEQAGDCFHHLLNEIIYIRPRVILALGNYPTRILADNPDLKITQERGKWFTEHITGMQIPVMPTFNPAYLFHQQGSQLTLAKSQIWTDIKRAAERAFGTFVPSL